MKAGIEWTQGVIRVGESDEWEHGEPYGFACSILKVGELAFIMGATGRFSKDVFRAIEEVLFIEGVKDVVWERKKNGRTKKVVLPVKPDTSR